MNVSAKLFCRIGRAATKESERIGVIVVHRSDGTTVRLHPGCTRADDAALVHVPAKLLQNRLDDLALIPQIDRFCL